MATLHPEIIEVINKNKRAVISEAEKNIKDNPKKYADDILDKRIHAAKLEHAIHSGIINPQARSAIREVFILNARALEETKRQMNEINDGETDERPFQILKQQASEQREWIQILRSALKK